MRSAHPFRTPLWPAFLLFLLVAAARAIVLYWLPGAPGDSDPAYAWTVNLVTLAILVPLEAG